MSSAPAANKIEFAPVVLIAYALVPALGLIGRVNWYEVCGLVPLVTLCNTPVSSVSSNSFFRMAAALVSASTYSATVAFPSPAEPDGKKMTAVCGYMRARARARARVRVWEGVCKSESGWVCVSVSLAL